MTSEPVVQSWPSMMSWVDPHPFNWVNSIKTQRNAIYGRPQKPTFAAVQPAAPSDDAGRRYCTAACCPARTVLTPTGRLRAAAGRSVCMQRLPATYTAWLCPLGTRDAVYVWFFSIQILLPSIPMNRNILQVCNETPGHTPNLASIRFS